MTRPAGPATPDSGVDFDALGAELANEYGTSRLAAQGEILRTLQRIAHTNSLEFSDLRTSGDRIRPEIADAIAALYDVAHGNSYSRIVRPAGGQGSWVQLLANPLSIGTWHIEVYYGDTKNDLEFAGATSAGERHQAAAIAETLVGLTVPEVVGRLAELNDPPAAAGSIN